MQASASTMGFALARCYVCCFFGASLPQAFLRGDALAFTFLRDALTVDLLDFLFLCFLPEQLELRLCFALWPLGSNLLKRF
jgi:hypothetical protein